MYYLIVVIDLVDNRLILYLTNDDPKKAAQHVVQQARDQKFSFVDSTVVFGDESFLRLIYKICLKMTECGYIDKVQYIITISCGIDNYTNGKFDLISTSITNDSGCQKLYDSICNYFH